MTESYANVDYYAGGYVYDVISADGDAISSSSGTSTISATSTQIGISESISAAISSIVATASQIGTAGSSAVGTSQLSASAEYVGTSLSTASATSSAYYTSSQAGTSTSTSDATSQISATANQSAISGSQSIASAEVFAVANQVGTSTSNATAISTNIATAKQTGNSTATSIVVSAAKYFISATGTSISNSSATTSALYLKTTAGSSTSNSLVDSGMTGISNQLGIASATSHASALTSVAKSARYIHPKHLIEKQLPYHVRESNPLFTKFLEYYYEFQQVCQIQDIIQAIRSYNDIDSVDETFLMEFFEEFKKIPTNIIADKRLVAKHVYDLYKSKGSERSLRLLFRIVYGEEVDIYYPSSDILRASDGRWKQESTITVRQISGNIDQATRIEFATSRGSFAFQISSYEQLQNNEFRISFDPRQTYHIDANQIVNLYSSDSIVFVGEAVLMPASIEIESGGAFWQEGQIVILPGEDRDTICQVKRVGAAGTIKKLDIIQYGLGYTADTTYNITPFQYSPSQSYTEMYSERISEFPPAYNHTINIFDVNDDISESVIGYTSDQRYVLEGYTTSGYINRVAFSQTYGQSQQSEIVNDDITIDDWIKSKARVKIRVGYSANANGYYDDFNGQLSVSSIRLQDNFYYQLFSYVITTSRMLSEYKNTLALIHPAGFKYFSNLEKDVSVDASVEVSRIISTT